MYSSAIFWQMSPDATRCHLLPKEHIRVNSQILTRHRCGSGLGSDVHFADTSGCVGLGLAEPVGVDGLVGVGVVDVLGGLVGVSFMPMQT